MTGKLETGSKTAAAGSPRQPGSSSRSTHYATELDVWDPLGRPALTQGETKLEYAAFARQFLSELRPKSVIEKIWTRDIVDLSWEVLRCRRLQAAIVRASETDAARALLSNIIRNVEHVSHLVEGWASGDKEIKKQVMQLFQRAKIDDDAIDGFAFLSRLRTVERLDAMAASKITQRNAVLREMDRHREFRARARETIETIEDADFEDIASEEADTGQKVPV